LAEGAVVEVRQVHKDVLEPQVQKEQQVLYQEQLEFKVVLV
jgi:hypothetical protein